MSLGVCVSGYAGHCVGPALTNSSDWPDCGVINTQQDEGWHKKGSGSSCNMHRGQRKEAACFGSKHHSLCQGEEPVSLGEKRNEPEKRSSVVYFPLQPSMGT